MDREIEKVINAIKECYPDGARKLDMPFADRKNDRARQKLRRDGVIAFEDRGNGKRWFLTEWF